MAITYRDMERWLRRRGFAKLRQSGDHAIYGLGHLRVPVRQGHAKEVVPLNTLRMMRLQAQGRQPISWGGVES